MMAKEVKQGAERFQVIMREFQPLCHWKNIAEKGQIKFSKATLLQKTILTNFKIAGSFYYQPEADNEEYVESIFVLPDYLFVHERDHEEESTPF
ncbi:MAG: hypothetical protein AAF620_14225 [Bacteroidota bacterium]